jgi:hypothetical protein
MRLMIKPNTIRGVRKKTRKILEKLKELAQPRKFEKVISSNNIGFRNGREADVQICINCVIETYKCFLDKQVQHLNYPNRKQSILYNNLRTLDLKVGESIRNGTPVPNKYISNVLKSQTIFFNSLKSSKINTGCSDPYDKLILSAISVWNNDWN